MGEIGRFASCVSLLYAITAMLPLAYALSGEVDKWFCKMLFVFPNICLCDTRGEMLKMWYQSVKNIDHFAFQMQVQQHLNLKKTQN
jgi:hypothetical protein